MTIRIIIVALWAFLLSGTIHTDRPWRAFWLALESVMLVAHIAYTVAEHRREVEKARTSLSAWRR